LHLNREAHSHSPHLEWLILGGGIHGTHLSLALIGRAGVSPAAVRVLDPYERPLAAWERRAESVGLPFLRSPDAHHLDLSAPSLHLFAHTARGHADQIRRFFRPSLALFRAHTDAVIRDRRLLELRLTGSARAIERDAAGLRVDTDRGELRARRVVIAIGAAGPAWPAWARELRAAYLDQSAGLIDHVLSDTFERDAFDAPGRVLVIGGGLSAVQVALALARGPARVTLLSRRPPGASDFDPESCWSTDRCLRRLARLREPAARRALVEHARRPGTIPPDVARQLAQAVRRGALEARVGEVIDASLVAADAPLRLKLAGGAHLLADRIVLATGVDRRLPAWLAASAAALDLPIAPCGAPLLDPRLRWAPGLHVSGAFAELELGPAAGNIIGARLAGVRLAREA